MVGNGLCLIDWWVVTTFSLVLGAIQLIYALPKFTVRKGPMWDPLPSRARQGTCDGVISMFGGWWADPKHVP